MAIGRNPATVGRSARNTILIDSPKVSRKHLEITPGSDGHWHIRDFGSTNGTRLNGVMITESILSFGDVLEVERYLLFFAAATSDGDTPVPILIETVLPSRETTDTVVIETEDGIARVLDLRRRSHASIGRGSDNDLVLSHPQVSRHHAQVRRDGGTYTIVDLNSTNGVFVNGKPVTRSTLSENARVQIGPSRFVFAGGVLSLIQDQIRVDLVDVIQRTTRHVTLLHDISCSVLPREFVAVVGSSGAGKSTLLNAMSGVSPASHGRVLYNGTDYYANMDEFRAQIGYVPQDDIVPMHLTVEEALTYAARLRLPHDTYAAEIESRVEEVMRDLDLTERRGITIVRLSGGQRKRVSIGVELLTKPTLFFLDEPTSGLDPSLEADMMQMLRKLADQGRTVILVTHATQNVTLCDKVIFLAPGGWLAFYGAPQEALNFFGAATFVEIYQALRPAGAGVEWAQRYASSDYFATHVRERLARIAAARTIQGDIPPVTVISDRTLQRAQSLNQFATLTARYVVTLRRDSRNLLLLLLQAPIIGLLLAIIFGRDVFTARTSIDATGHEVIANPWDKVHALQLTTMIVIVALWFGASNSAREIVKEANVYRRERMINLRLGPYLGSKLVVLLGLCLVQDVTMLGIVGLLSPYRFQRAEDAGHTLGGPWMLVLGSLLVVSFAGVGMGLLASAVASNADRVTSVVPIILIPQILF
ncbi:MAG TPA: FHA domain-containing protein, partial [Nitrolancea sp.]|nr:FHA domain-containing protein [Nitrolancea sp.]